MLKRTTCLALLAAGAMALTAGTAGAHATRHHVRHHHHAKPPISYQYRGTVSATTATSITLTVKGGNHAGLHSLIGAGASQTFTVGPKTSYVMWADGVPDVGAQSLIANGDSVRIDVRAARGATLATVEGTAARSVTDTTVKAHHPAHTVDFLFKGTLTADPDTANSKLTLHVTGGNSHALHLLVGQSADETFTYDSNTIFVRWAGRVPSTVSAGDLHAGDTTWIHVWVPRHSTLVNLLATAAFRVAEHCSATCTS
jgi:hypothetical protein